MTFLQQYLNLERQSGWKAMPGTKANSNQSGPTGSATFTLGTATTPMVLTCKPDAGQSYYDAGFYIHLPFTFGKEHVACYHVEYTLSAAELANCNQLEMDAGAWTGTHRHHVGGQFHKTFRYYDPSAKPKWVDTGIPLTITPGQPFAVEIWCKLDIVAQQTTYMGVKANGVWLPLTPGLTVIADADATPNPMWSPILQLDSTKAAQTFSAAAQNVHLVVR